MAYTDSFGLKQPVGLGEGKDLNGCVSEVTFGAIHQISVDIRGENMPKADTEALTLRAAKLPRGCAVLSAILVVEKPAHTPGSTLSVGTVKLSGQAGAALIENANTSAGVKNGAGALLDKVVEGESENPNDDDLYINISTEATAEALAGLKAKLIVEYV